MKHPMDLGHGRQETRKTTSMTWEGPSQFVTDVQLTFHNCLAYNPVGTDGAADGGNHAARAETEMDRERVLRRLR